MLRHVDPIEAQEVARLAAAGHAATPGEGPTVESLAEALGLPPSEVERLLAQVRGRQAVPVAVPPRRTFGDRSAALSAAIVLALVLVVAAVGAFLFVARGAPLAQAPSPAMETPGPGASINVDPNGNVRIQGPSGTVVAPATPIPPSAESATTPAMSAEDALKDAQRRLEEAQARLKEHESQADRAQAEAEIAEMRAEVARFEAEVQKEAASLTPDPSASK